MCARARHLQRGACPIVLLDLLETKLWSSNADFKRLVSSIGTSVSFIRTDGNSHTLGSSVGSDRSGVGLWCFSSRLEDEHFIVDGDSNLLVVVDSVRLWPGFLARRVVGDGEKWLNVLRCCASESCSMAKLHSCTFGCKCLSLACGYRLVTRLAECDTSIDRLNGDTLACRFEGASKKSVGTAKFQRDSPLLYDSYEAVLAETHSNLPSFSDVKGSYFFGLHTKKKGLKIVQSWTSVSSFLGPPNLLPDRRGLGLRRTRLSFFFFFSQRKANRY